MVVCAVFVPIMFIAGQTGLLFRELAAAMIGAVAFSGFFALSLAPMLCSKLLRHEKQGPARGLDRAPLPRGSRRRYANGLDWVLRKPLIPVAVVARVPRRRGLPLHHCSARELVPAEDAGILQVNITAPEGTSFAQMSRYMTEVQARLLPMVGQGAVRSLIIRVPGGFGPSDDFNNGAMSMFLQALGGARASPPPTWSSRVNRELAQIPAVRGNAQVRNSLNRGRGQPINFVIAGATYPDLARARDRILAAAASNPGIVNLDSDYKENKPQLQHPGRYRARRRSRRLGRRRVERAADPARLAPGLDLCRPRPRISRRRPGRAGRAHRPGQSRPDLRAQPHRHAGAAVQPGHHRGHRRARATSAATTSCARSRSRAASRPATRSARR